MLVHGKPMRVPKEDLQENLRVGEFASRFLDGCAKADRLKPSGIRGKNSTLGVHLVSLFGDKRLHEIQTEHVQHLKAALRHRAAKTVTNVLTVLKCELASHLAHPPCRPRACSTRRIMCTAPDRRNSACVWWKGPSIT
jgi:hypothetical protein